MLSARTSSMRQAVGTTALSATSAVASSAAARCLHMRSTLLHPHPSSSSAAPLRVAILGAGLSGLTLAHQLQRKFREVGRGDVEIHMHEKTARSGGWIHTVPSGKGHTLENGPRSFMYRKDTPSKATLELLSQLHLGPHVILADPAAARRFVWNSSGDNQKGDTSGKLIPLPSGLKSLLNFPHSGALLRGLAHEFRTPSLSANAPEEVQDESVTDWVTRRFNATIASELIDPMIAGIYAGDPARLSLQSCLTRLAKSERRSGGILRDMVWRSREAKAKSLAEFEATAESERLLDEQRMLTGWKEQDWVKDVKSSRAGIFGLAGGLGVLTRALRLRLASDAADPYALVLTKKNGAPDAQFTMHTQVGVRGLKINQYNKPVLVLQDLTPPQTTATSTAIVAPPAMQEVEYDHVFSTLPTCELHGLLSAPATSLPLSSEAASRALELIAPTPSATPFASVWCVHVLYNTDLLPGEKKGFGLLVPSAHAIAGQEILGITFDSCVFPSQNSLGSQQSSAGGSGSGETRLTVMIGGDRHPWLVEASETDISIHALRAIETLMGVDHRVTRPTLVNAVLNRNCIPQFYVGHAKRTHEFHEIMKHVAYTPSSFTLPCANPLPALHVDMHEAAVRAAADANRARAYNPAALPALRPISLLGTNYGVSLNDCIYHATTTAADFVERTKPAPTATLHAM